MAQWQIVGRDGGAQPETFDDGLPGGPGDEGFTTDAVRAECDRRGKGLSFNYMGPSPALPEA